MNFNMEIRRYEELLQLARAFVNSIDSYQAKLNRPLSESEFNENLSVYVRRILEAKESSERYKHIPKKVGDLEIELSVILEMDRKGFIDLETER